MRRVVLQHTHRWEEAAAAAAAEERRRFPLEQRLKQFIVGQQVRPLIYKFFAHNFIRISIGERILKIGSAVAEISSYIQTYSYIHTT